MSAGRLPVFACAILALGLFVSCTTGPRPPQPGTPAFYWSAAEETYRLGDYLKTADNLGSLTRTENPYTARARVWEIVVSAGVARGFLDLADAAETGARVNRQSTAAFRRHVSLFRGSAAGAALQFAEAFHRYQDADKQVALPLAFAFPKGNPGLPAEARRLAAGILLPDAEMERLQRAMLQRGVLLTACRAAGAPDDPARTAEFFRNPNSTIPREGFLLQMANLLYDEAQLFAPTKLDQPNRLKLLCMEAMEAVAALPPSPRAKDLAGKLQTALKKKKAA